MNNNTYSKSFVAGSFGGLCGIVLSHPFDTIRVRIQTEKKFTYKGIRDLYKGLAPPLLGVVMEKTIVFGGYNYAHTQLERLYPDNPNRNNFIAGLFSGLACSVIVTPIDRIKINLQASKSQYRNTYDYFRREILVNNNINQVRNNLYKGWTSTLTREIPGYGLYFSTYNYIKNQISDFRSYHAFFAGGLSGGFSWIFIYPSDVIKSRIQVQNSPYNGMLDCIYKSVKSDGISVLYRGFSTALYRAVPLHAGVFMGYEIFMNLMK